MKSRKKAKLAGTSGPSSSGSTPAPTTSDDVGAVKEYSGPSSSSSAHVPQAAPATSTYDLDFVNELLPKVVGCSASKESKFHSRWRVKYPCVDGTRSKNFGGTLSEKDAIKFLVRWVWRLHSTENNCENECPDLDALMD